MATHSAGLGTHSATARANQRAAPASTAQIVTLRSDHKTDATRHMRQNINRPLQLPRNNKHARTQEARVRVRMRVRRRCARRPASSIFPQPISISSLISSLISSPISSPISSVPACDDHVLIAFCPLAPFFQDPPLERETLKPDTTLIASSWTQKEGRRPRKRNPFEVASMHPSACKPYFDCLRLMKGWPAFLRFLRFL